MAILVIIEIVCGSLLIVYRDRVREYAKTYFQEAIHQVEQLNNKKLEEAVSALQQEVG